jgi:hypothetical protein
MAEVTSEATTPLQLCGCSDGRRFCTFDALRLRAPLRVPVAADALVPAAAPFAAERF